MSSAQALPSPTDALRSSYLNALSQSSDALPPSPESSSSSAASVGFMEMSDLMLPASALEIELFGVPQHDSGATVVSTASSYDEVSSLRLTKKRRSSTASERRHALPSTLLLSDAVEAAVTQPVPEFLCHLHTMLCDPSYSDLISWKVPKEDEPDHLGGGVAGVGKIVVHKPESLQESVLGKYYRHSKYASFQRQLNYFGFKKRLHNGKKGKLSPCSYIHETLGEDVGSLFTLKRRPPAKKRALEACEDDCSASTSSQEGSSPSRSKKRRVLVEKKSKKSGKSKSKKEPKKKQQIKVVKVPDEATSTPHHVEAEEYGPPSNQSSAAIKTNRYQEKEVTVIIVGNTTSAEMITHTPKPAIQVTQPPAVSKQPDASPQASHSTLLDLLSTYLPSSDILFNDAEDEDSTDDEGLWVTDDGKYYHNVDSSLVNLAMLY